VADHRAGGGVDSQCRGGEEEGEGEEQGS
jgi:hypothetical protein